MIKTISKNTLKAAIRLIENIVHEINELMNPTEDRLKELINAYKTTGLGEDRDKHIQKLNNSLSSLGFTNYNEKIGMYSEHLIIFAALSSILKNPENILEIGTYDGKTACILANLFPKSTVITVDLKNNDPAFIKTYNRENDCKNFIRERDERINKFSNIKFIQGNSLDLTFSENIRKQDLIWVDGAHGYPNVTSDITNCLRILAPEGILMCDDVWKKIKYSDKVYSSIATYETLCSFEKAKIIKTIYFKKRIGKRFNGNYKNISLSMLCNSNKRKNNIV